MFAALKTVKIRHPFKNPASPGIPEFLAAIIKIEAPVVVPPVARFDIDGKDGSCQETLRQKPKTLNKYVEVIMIVTYFAGHLRALGDLDSSAATAMISTPAKAYVAIGMATLEKLNPLPDRFSLLGEWVRRLTVKQ